MGSRRRGNAGPTSTLMEAGLRQRGVCERVDEHPGEGGPQRAMVGDGAVSIDATTNSPDAFGHEISHRRRGVPSGQLEFVTLSRPLVGNQRGLS